LLARREKRNCARKGGVVGVEGKQKWLRRKTECHLNPREKGRRSWGRPIASAPGERRRKGGTPPQKEKRLHSRSSVISSNGWKLKKSYKHSTLSVKDRGFNRGKEKIKGITYRYYWGK